MRKRHIPSRPQMAIALVMLIAGSLTLTGCLDPTAADYSGLGLADVSGTVTLDGEPVVDVHVIFEDDQRNFSSGETDSSGQYRLMFNSEHPGVMPGPKTVRVSAAAASAEEGEEMSWQSKDKGKSKVDPDSEDYKPNFETIPECYNNDTKLSVDVETGSQTINFELKSDCSTTGPA